jgi:Glycosyl transferase family 2
MHSTNETPLDAPFPAIPTREAVVQDRPMLGSLPRTKRSRGWWLIPGIDLACSSAVLTLVALLDNSAVFPAVPIAPLILVAVCGALGVYGVQPSRGGFGEEGGPAWPVIRLMAAVLFAWSASLLTDLTPSAQLALLAGFVILAMAARGFFGPRIRRLDPVERWVLVGEDSTAERLKAYRPLQAHATLVCTVPPSEDRSKPADRAAALDLVDRYHADRVVISSSHADDESLLDVVRAFKSTGVPVSLLPRPLDLLDGPSAMPSQVGGVPLIEVQALAARGSVPYAGPDRRRDRNTKVSVVVPAINEALNIGHVLSRLPDDLHEVILVDGNSDDETVEAARHAYPEIRVLTQNGRGKGDALRTGFAAVTGNLVVMLDADGSADPAEIPRFVEALEAGADFAKGSRFLDGGGSDDITVLRRLGNAVLSGTANVLHGTHFTDLCYGYNAFWARCLPFISLDAPGFEVETLINLRIAASGMKITEVPSYEADRMSGHSNLNTFRDGTRVLGTILTEARRRRGIQRVEPATAGNQQKAKAAATTA